MVQESLVVCYEATVRGQYQSADGKSRVLRTFGPVTFVLPEYVDIPNGKKRVNKTVDGSIVQSWEPQFKKSAITTENVALYVVQRRLLPSWLADHHKDCVVFRTCAIVPGGLRRVMRPAKDAQVLDKPLDQMSIPELASFCKVRGLNVQVSAFGNVVDAREAVKYELEMGGTAAPMAADAVLPTEDSVPAGVLASSGPVTSADSVPTDEEDPAAGLM
jgi:hypothetical protein